VFYVFVPESLISEWCEIYKPKAQAINALQLLHVWIIFSAKAHQTYSYTNVENIDDANTEEAGDANTFNNNDLPHENARVINSFDGHKFMCLMYEINR
jgi:hypothetical protein